MVKSQESSTKIVEHVKPLLFFVFQDNETKKRQLEEDIDSLNEEISQLKATEEMNKVASDKREEDREMKEALEQQISQVHFRAHPVRIYNIP